jgi:hypothetical protein
MKYSRKIVNNGSELLEEAVGSLFQFTAANFPGATEETEINSFLYCTTVNVGTKRM